MDLTKEVAATGAVGALGLIAIIRFALISWYKDRTQVNATDATTQVITTLRDELKRLSALVSESTQLSQQLRDERDGLRTEVAHLTYAVNAVKDILVEVLGEQGARTRFVERGIHRQFGKQKDSLDHQSNQSTTKDQDNE